MVDNLEYIKENPFLAVKHLATRLTMKNRALFDFERKQLLSAIDCDELLLSCELQFYCFMRPSEIRQIQLRDIDLKMMRIRIYPEVSKGNTYRVVEIPEVFRKRILDLEISRKPQRLYLLGFREKQYSKNVIYNRLKKILIRLEMDSDITNYSWKHTGVVAAHRAGVDIYSIFRQGGWKDWKSFENYLKSLGLYFNKEIINKMPVI